MTPSSMTKELLTLEGYTILPSEWQVPRTYLKKDLGGFADYVCLRKDDKLLAVQRTESYNGQARVDKIKGLKTAWDWLATEHARIEVWEFRKLKGGWWLKRTEMILNPFGDETTMVDLLLSDELYEAQATTDAA